MNIYFLGPEGSYSHQVAVLEYKVDQNKFYSCLEFSEIYEKVEKDSNGIGILPIENSITNNVHENVEFLFMRKAKIIAETFLSIKLHLIGYQEQKLEEVEQVLSHPKAIAQCTNFINQHKLAVKACASTTAACSEILSKQNKSLAAIAGLQSLELYPTLKVLSDNVGNEALNLTRFAHISAHISNPELGNNLNQSKKFTLIFRTLHECGALAKLLTALADNQVNLNKIESQPIPGSQFEYSFLVDLEMPTSAKNESDSIAVLNQIFSANTSKFWIIGAYHPGKIFD